MMGIDVRLVTEETPLQHSIANIMVFDQRHFMETKRYEYESGKEVRFGIGCKHDEAVCTRYVRTFSEVWKSQLLAPAYRL